jgi:hypothetical protein
MTDMPIEWLAEEYQVYMWFSIKVEKNFWSTNHSPTDV